MSQKASNSKIADSYGGKTKRGESGGLQNSAEDSTTPETVHQIPKSDFSIEHILTKAGAKAGPDKPAWLNCTRYKPPCLPRRKDSQIFQKRSRRSNCHARIPFSCHQSQVLENSFYRSNYLSPAQLTALADSLDIREQRIKIWFQNRRARERREVQNKPTTALEPSIGNLQNFHQHCNTSKNAIIEKQPHSQ